MRKYGPALLFVLLVLAEEIYARGGGGRGRGHGHWGHWGGPASLVGGFILVIVIGVLGKKAFRWIVILLVLIALTLAVMS